MSAFADKLAALREVAAVYEGQLYEDHKDDPFWPKKAAAASSAYTSHLVNSSAEIEALVRAAIHYIPYCDHYQCRICLAMARKNKAIDHDPDCALAALEKK